MIFAVESFEATKNFYFCLGVINEFGDEDLFVKEFRIRFLSFDTDSEISIYIYY